jgi:putative hydrolase of the HAD superfamily
LREPRLRHVLRSLPGKKVLYTNAPKHYALAVLKLLRIADLFDEVMAVEHTGYRPKPHTFGFLRLLQKHRVKPAQCVMVEDSLENLRTAKKLGMRTVWVNPGQQNEACVDVKIKSVLQLSSVLKRLV